MRGFVIALGLVLVFPSAGSLAQEAPAEEAGAEETNGKETEGEEEPSPEILSQAAYDDGLNRLGEIHGALFHLDALCRPGREGIWRTHMEDFLAAQRLGEVRSGRLIARFNSGYRDHAALHVTCTPAARELSRRFAREGVAIASDLAARYGN
ncbi:MAG: TIGR02301 family protein [Pseudomonadota bacterium]